MGSLSLAASILLVNFVDFDVSRNEANTQLNIGRVTNQGELISLNERFVKIGQSIMNNSPSTNGPTEVAQ